MVVATEIITEAPDTDQKSEISKTLLHLAVNMNIAAFTTKANNPKDNKIAGSVNNLTNEPITPFIRPNKSATHK